VIDLSTETLKSLSEAAKLLPRRRRGKRPHPSTLHRWATNGLRGEKLEVLRVGGTICTSEQALCRFFERLTKGDRTLGATIQTAEITVARSDADQELDELGL
jgi:hypothetical protein